jgi:4-hydroxymandelate oxidase
MKEIRQKAREMMKGHCRVCKVCDGSRCVSGVPGMGGVGSGAGFRANSTALVKLRLNMRVIHGVAEPDTGIKLLGLDLPMPVLAAPVAGAGFNMGTKVSEKEYTYNVLAGCLEAGILGCCGEGPNSEIFEGGVAAIKELGGAGIPVLKPWQKEKLFARLETVQRAGAKIVGIDVDAIGLNPVHLDTMFFSKTVAQLKEIVSAFDLKIVLKGIMTTDDALAAIEAGVAGIVVSNHGGRVMEHTPGTAEVLPAIAQAVKGRLALLVDGGVRSGGDVLKMLALGADAVLIGRPLAWMAMGGGKDGVALYLERVKREFNTAMVLAGCRDLKEVGPRVIYGA